MASISLQPVNEHRWLRGFGNLLDKENGAWWHTRMGLIQALIWIGIIGSMLAAVTLGSKEFELTQGAMVYSIFAGMFPAIAVIIILQDALVGEKKDGTAAWVLSKPVARPALILAKLVANSLGVLVTMVLLPGVLAFILLSLGARSPVNPPGFLAAMGVIFLNQLFYLTLTLMLGTFYSQRGPVIGIPIAFVFLQQYFIGMVPPAVYILPWTLAVPLNSTTAAVAPALILGEPVYSYLPIVAVAAECILFTLVALRRFDREEF